MTERQIDTIVRTFATGTTRRAGVSALLAAAFGSAVSIASAGAPKNGASNGKSGSRTNPQSATASAEADAAGAPGTEGPCGNGKVSDNKCTKNSDCCTNRCANKRCRCITAKNACTATSQCCKGLTCAKGVCSRGGAPEPAGPTGPRGAAGPAGPQGTEGPTGPAGTGEAFTGPAGPQGAAGTGGAQGVAGPQGASGAAGSQGPSGAQGASGPQGVTGPAGPNVVNASDFKIVSPTGKELVFDLSQIPNNTTRTLSAPNLDGTYVTTTGPQVVKDKTFSPSTAGDPAAIFKGVNGQEAPLLLLRDNNNVELARISADTLDNTWFGKSAGAAITTGQSNSGFGFEALRFNTNGGFNAAYGKQALGKNTSGSNNAALGYQALANHTTGGNNTAVGYQALFDVATGQFNTGVGYQAAIGGAYDYSVAFGVSTSVNANYGAAVGSRTIVSANFGAAFGTDAKVLAGGAGSVAIGKDAQTSDPDVIQLGTTNTVVKANNFTPTPSDLRDKADVRDTQLGLEFIAALRPVDYRYDFREDYRPAAPAAPGAGATEAEKAAYERAFAAWSEASKLGNLAHDGTKKRTRYHHGLIAQEVETLLKERGIDFGGYQDGTYNGGEDRKMLAYPELIAPMIKAIQDLLGKVDAQAARIEALEQKGDA